MLDELLRAATRMVAPAHCVCVGAHVRSLLVAAKTPGSMGPLCLRTVLSGAERAEYAQNSLSCVEYRCQVLVRAKRICTMATLFKQIVAAQISLSSVTYNPNVSKPDQYVLHCRGCLAGVRQIR